MNNLKKAFGIVDMSYNWNRETIKTALYEYLERNGEIFQKDLIKSNGLPSLPCILSYYPEYKNFTDIKRGLCEIDVPENWTVDNAITAGKAFLEHNNKITQKDLNSRNNLPSANVINKLFGSLANYQELVGCEVTQRNEYITDKQIENAINLVFNNGDYIIESQQVFFEKFKYSQSVIQKRYGSFLNFCNKYNIKVEKSKKPKYTKREVDDAISNWVMKGNSIPPMKELARLGLPSQSVILKYYEDWKEPFYLYEKMFEEVNRNKS
ncbi:MAG: hypothetical protein IJF80_00030 [Clostridia bacterium]|nr:hypothetical protein [Clostridia bacterium]